MAETTKLQLFVKVLGRLGWKGCSVFLCKAEGWVFLRVPFPCGGLKLPHTGLNSQAAWGRSSYGGGIR